MKLWLSLMFMLVSLAWPPAHGLAQSFSADDFLPPAQAGSEAEEADLRQVQAPNTVKSETGDISGQPAIKAASSQDAINAYLAQRSAGFTELQFPSGYGFVATGVSTYGKHSSVVAARIDQRNAYNKAYTNAKKNLAEGLYGISNEGQTKIAESMTNIDTADGRTLTNISDLSSEQIRQSVEGLLRGYVVYDVFDDFDNSTIYVTIVTTPKTQGHYARPDANTIVADSVRDGLEQVVTESKKSLVPPVGGRTVFVPATGELAFVGFGSAVVRVDKEQALQAKHNLNAEKIAKMRAADALCGLILGDKIASTDQLDSQTKTLIADFEEVSDGDPLASPQSDSSAYKALEQRKKDFLSTEMSSATVTSLRKGVLPPGVKTQGWRDSENAFAYAMAVYMPSATARASQARDSMRQGTIVQSPGSGGSEAAPEASPLTPGPSGRVQDDESL